MAGKQARPSMLVALISTRDLGDQVLRWLDIDSKKQLKLVCRSLCEDINRPVTRASWYWYDDPHQQLSSVELLELLLCLPKLPALSSVAFSPSHVTTEVAAAVALACSDSVVQRTGQGAVLLPGPGGQPPLCQRLRRLELGGRAWSSAVLAEVFRMPWPVLEELVFSWTRIEERSATELAKAALPRLRRLALARNPLLRSTFAALAQGKWPQLEELDLSCNGWLEHHDGPSPSAEEQDAAVTALAASFGTRLRALDVSFFNMCSAALTLIVQGQWPCLESLKLTNNKVTGVSAAALCLPSSLPALRHLAIDIGDVTPQLAAALAARTGLTSLCLRHGSGFDPDLFTGMAPWPNLQALQLVGFLPWQVPLAQVLHPARFPCVSQLTFRSCSSGCIAGVLLQVSPDTDRRWPSQVQQLRLGIERGLAVDLFEALATVDWPVLEVVIMNLSSLRLELREGHGPTLPRSLRAFLARCPSLQEHNLQPHLV